MREKKNVLEEKSFVFAIDVERFYKKISSEEKEYVLSKQFLRSGTSIGANVAEANGAISNADFSAKISIAYKKSLETKYWLKLFKASGYTDEKNFDELFEKADELSRTLYHSQKNQDPQVIFSC